VGILGGISALVVPIGAISLRGFRFNQRCGAGISLQAQIDQTFPDLFFIGHTSKSRQFAPEGI
jgi:hypothetical protein